MTKLAALAGAAALAVVLLTGSAYAGTPKLVASVSDPANISLTMNGKKVKTLKAGTYSILVKDTAADHDFHLIGPGVNKTTTTSGKTTTTWVVKFRKGTYKYQCDPHSSFMKGSFTVT